LKKMLHVGEQNCQKLICFDQEMRFEAGRSVSGSAQGQNAGRKIGASWGIGQSDAGSVPPDAFTYLGRMGEFRLDTGCDSVPIAEMWPAIGLAHR
jgi:hypothetical protein